MGCRPLTGLVKSPYSAFYISDSSLGGRFIEAPLFQVLDQGCVHELGNVGPTEIRASFNPVPPLRAAFDGQRGRPWILPCWSRLGLRHLPSLHLSILRT